MFRGLAVRLSGTIYKPRCLHAYKPLHTIARTCVEQKHIFPSIQQRLQTRQGFLTPNKEILQEIGEEIQDLQEIGEEIQYHKITDVKWMASVTDFCNKLGISHEVFGRLFNSSPLLEFDETIQHLSEIVDILTDYGYGPSAKALLVRNINKFSVTNKESVRAALEEHGRNILEDWLQSFDVSQVELLDSKLKYPLTAKAIAYLISLEKHPLRPHFPWQILSDHDEFYKKSVIEFLTDEAGIDKRVVFAVWPNLKPQDSTNLWQSKARIVRLQIEGLEAHDILEHLNMVMSMPSQKFMNCIEEIRKVGLQKSWEIIYSNSLNPRNLVMKTLSTLFKCPYKDFSTKEWSYFHGRSKLNAATVFFLLKDEGFRREEIRKTIFLLGVPENEIRQYLNSSNTRSLTEGTGRRRFLREMHDDLVEFYGL